MSGDIIRPARARERELSGPRCARTSALSFFWVCAGCKSPRVRRGLSLLRVARTRDVRVSVARCRQGQCLLDRGRGGIRAFASRLVQHTVATCPETPGAGAIAGGATISASK